MIIKRNYPYKYNYSKMGRHDKGEYSTGRYSVSILKLPNISISIV